jgi:hypothetical protein
LKKKPQISTDTDSEALIG